MEDFEFSPGLFLYCDISDGQKARPLVPKEWRQTIVQMYHNLHHPGVKATTTKVGQRYYWPHMREDIAYFVNKCYPCQVVKIHKNIKLPPTHRPVLPQRFSDIMCDVVGPLSERAMGTAIYSLLWIEPHALWRRYPSWKPNLSPARRRSCPNGSADLGSQIKPRATTATRL